MVSTLKDLCEKFNLDLPNECISKRITRLLKFEDFSIEPVFYKSANPIYNCYVFSNNSSKLIFYPNNKDRMITYYSSNYKTFVSYDFWAHKVISVESLLFSADLKINLSEKINEMFIQDYNYSFDSMIINNDGYESYIFKSETKTEEYMLIITPEDKEKTLIEYVHPKGNNRKSFEEITITDGSLYRIT